jgi:hypothetical protein
LHSSGGASRGGTRRVAGNGIGAGVCAGIDGARFGDQMIKERAIVNHCLAKVLRAGFASAMAEGDFMSGSVVVDHGGMIDGDVGGSLFEIGDRIAAHSHDSAKQLIGLSDGAGGVVHEMGLHAGPFVDEMSAIGRTQGAQVVGLHAVRAFRQFGFGAAAVPTFSDGTFVLRSELSAKARTASVARKQVRNKPDDDQQDNCDRNDLTGVQVREIHSLFPSDDSQKFLINHIKPK